MSNPKTVDSSLWFDSFTTILTDLENASLSSDLPPHLVTTYSFLPLYLFFISLQFEYSFVLQAKKLKDNHAWFVETVSLFKKPNANSREALNSEIVKIGSHEVTVKPELKVKALHISSYLVSFCFVYLFYFYSEISIFCGYFFLIFFLSLF